MPTEDAGVDSMPDADREQHVESVERIREVLTTTPSPGPLGELLAYIEATTRALKPAAKAEDASDTSRSPACPSAVLEEFQHLWGRIRNDSQLRQSMAAVPRDAGPLHSSALLHRAMTLMQNAAPGYLEHFIAYVDALSWMEQLQQDGVLEPPAPPRGADTRTARKPRVRKRATPR